MIEIDILPASSEKKGGDSVLIRIGNFDYSDSRNNQKVILIDSGYSENAQRIKEYLKDYYQTHIIDLVIITHPDIDHISGFKTLLEDNSIVIKKTYIHDPWNHTSHMFTRTKDNRRTVKSLGSAFDETLSRLSDILDKLNTLEIENIEPFGYAEIKGFNLHILGPDRKFYRDTLYKFDGMEGTSSQYNGSDIYEPDLSLYNDDMPHFLENPKTSPKNETSVITLLQDHQGKPLVLFTGDAGVEAINKALDNADNAGIDYSGVYLFQIPHHGSIKNIDQAVIDRISPINAYVSAPSQKPEHPSPLLINYFLKNSIPTYHIKDKSGIVFYHGTQHRRPSWGVAAPASKNNRVYKLKRLFKKIFR